MVMFYLLIVFSISALDSEEATCVITGSVYNTIGNPLNRVQVILWDTGQGAMTDSCGKYCIPDMPVDSIVLSVRETGSLEIEYPISTNRDDVNLLTNPNSEELNIFIDVSFADEDTVVVNIVYAPQDSYIMTLNKKYVDLAFSDSIRIQVENWQDVDLGFSQIWSGYNLLPSMQVNDSTIVALTPAEIDTFALHIFPESIVQVVKTDADSTIIVRCSSEVDNIFSFLTYPGGEFSNRFECIDLAQWGNCLLENWGLIGIEISYNRENQPRFLLIYNERCVIIDCEQNSTVIEFPFPTFYYKIDENLHYLLIWEVFGQDGISGNVSVISLEDETCSIFDPTPDIYESNIHAVWWGHDYHAILSNKLELIDTFHLTSSGHVVRLFNNNLQVFNRNGSLITDALIDDLSSSDFYYTNQFLSLNQSAISALFSDDSLNYCITIGLNGWIYNVSSLPLPSLLTWSSSFSSYNPKSAVIWIPLHSNGAARIDCLTGKCIYRDGLRINNIRNSENFELLGLNIHSMNESIANEVEVSELWDWDTAERISAFVLPENDSGNRPRLISISNSGDLLFDCRVGYYKINSVNRLVLTDSMGNVVISPSIFNRSLNGHYSSLSPDGSKIVYVNGKYLTILHLVQEKL